jgi:nucleotide-binding universal stress UspA family protein
MKIIIALDGSEYGTRALNFTTRLLCEAGSEIEIVTVIEPAAGMELETIIESTETLFDPNRPEFRSASELLERSKSEVTEAVSGKRVTTSTKVLAGPAARAIVEDAESWNAELIVVGSHGRGFWKRAWLGSVSDRIVNHAHCAVLIVR